MTAPKSVFEKIWDGHVIRDMGDGTALLFVDRHILQEASCAQAFQRLSRAGRKVRRPELTFGVIDHLVSTRPGRTAASNPEGSSLISAIEANCRQHGILLFGLDDPRQGIEHVVAPELGIVSPGMTVVCADSHTPTNGAFGAYAWGFGTADVEHVLATQTVLQPKPKTMRINFTGALHDGVYPKDLILHLIGRIGMSGGRGYAVEYAGSTIQTMSMEGRMTVCNMSIEFGSRAGLIAPDDVTFQYMAGREFAPKGREWDAAIGYWHGLKTDDETHFDKELGVDCDKVEPQVTWGVFPEHVIDINGRIPDPAEERDAARKAAIERALRYMGLEGGRALAGTPIHVAFIGSCTNSRLSDLQAAAAVVEGRHVAPGVRALVVPGSSGVKRAAERLGLDIIFKSAGFEWRESGCSMCLGMNDDQVAPGQRCMSSSNRNFENRQGAGARTHLASPASVAASAVTGVITDVRRLAH